MKKNYYSLHFQTQAGGGYFEDIFITSNLDDVKIFITRSLYNPYIIFNYGLDMDLTVVQNAIVVNKNIKSDSETKISLFSNILSNTRITIKDCPVFYFDSRNWIFSPKSPLNNDQDERLKRLIDSEDLSTSLEMIKEYMNIEIDWESINIPMFAENGIKKSEAFKNELSTEPSRVKLGLCLVAKKVPIGVIMEEANSFLKQIAKIV